MNYWAAPEIYFNENENNPIHIDNEDVILKICKYYKVSLDELMSKSRLRRIVDARNTLYYIFHKCCNITCEEVGRLFNKHHATVLNGANRIEGFMRYDKKFKRQINQIINLNTIKYN